MRKFRHGPGLAITLAVGAAAAPWSLAAQALPPSAALPTPQQLNPAGQPQAQPPRKRREVWEPPTPGACPLATSPLTFHLASVEFEGMKALSPADLAPAYAEFIGKDIRMATLCEIRDRAAEIFFHRGILARIDIPPQHIADGHFVLRVIEARIASVRVVGNVGPAQSKVEDYIEHLRGLAPFDLRTAQRYLLLASDIPGIHVSASLSPSPQGPGAVDMVVNVTREAVDGVVNVTNYNSKELGPWGALARLDLNSFTAFGERTSLVAYSSLFDDRQQVIQLVQEARIGSDGLLGRFSIAYGRDNPGAELAPLDLKGTSFVASDQLVYPIVRARRENLNITGGLDVIDQKTVLGGVGGGTLNNDKLRIVYVRLDGDVRENLALGSVLAGGVEVRQGLEWLGASRVGETDLSRIDGHPDATVLRADGHWATQWTSKFSTLVSVQAQYANETVLSYEELQIGNLTIGRGYDPSSVAGDRGIAGTFEARLGPYRLTRWASIQFYGFYDAAYAKSLVDSPDFTRTVTSAGGGIRLAFTPRLSLDVMYANPFDRINALALAPPPARVLVSLVARFP
ncbi:MAG: ShlB/FhaC/HecB family hemolysin secretion/activation protein [Caulobacteraceae bacterium]